MGRPPAVNSEARARVLAIVRQRPGINSHNLAIAAGLPPKQRGQRGGYALAYKEINAVLRDLEKLGEIRTESIWDMPGNPMRVFAADYQPPPKRPLFHPATGFQQQCKTWIDPAIRGTWSPTDAPVRSKIADLPSGVPFKPEKQEKSMSKTYRDRINEILDRIEQEGTLPMRTMTSICQEAGANQNYISLNLDLKERYYSIQEKLLKGKDEAEAIAEITEIEAELQAHQQEPPAPPPQTGNLSQSIDAAEQQWREQQQSLQQRLAELERQNAALKAELATPPMQPSPLKGAIDFVEAVRADIASLEADLERITAEEKQLQGDKAAVVTKLHAAREYYELRTGERPPLRLEIVSNGKRPVEVDA